MSENTCAYGMETEQLAGTVRYHLDGAERNENVTDFLATTVYLAFSTLFASLFIFTLCVILGYCETIDCLA
jgi:hypothetical protein